MSLSPMKTLLQLHKAFDIYKASNYAIAIMLTMAYDDAIAFFAFRLAKVVMTHENAFTLPLAKA